MLNKEIEKIQKIDDFYNDDSPQSILINTHLVFNTFNLLGTFTDSTYNIYIACKFLGDKISTTTITKWLKKNLNKKLTYTTIRKHLELLEEYRYIERYSKNSKYYRLISELVATDSIIYGNYNKNKKVYYKTNTNKAKTPLKYIREINYKKYSSKMYVSKNDSDKIFEYQKRAIEFNKNYKKQCYTEKIRFKFFEDYNDILNGYKASRMLFNKKSIKEMSKYTSARTYFDEQLVTVFWYSRPVTKFDIIRVLHTTKASIDQFRCEKEKYYIDCVVKQNEDDKFKYYKAHQKEKGIADIKGKAETLLGVIYKRDEYNVRFEFNEFVSEHLFYDTDDAVYDFKNRKFEFPEKLDHDEKISFNIITKARDKVSISLECSEGSEEIDSQIVPVRQIKTAKPTINVARRRTNNYQSLAYLSDFKTKNIMPKIHDIHYLLYVKRNMRRIRDTKDSKEFYGRKKWINKKQKSIKSAFHLLQKLGYDGVHAKRDFNKDCLDCAISKNKVTKQDKNRFNFIVSKFDATDDLDDYKETYDRVKLAFKSI